MYKFLRHVNFEDVINAAILFSRIIKYPALRLMQVKVFANEILRMKIRRWSVDREYLEHYIPREFVRIATVYAFYHYVS